MVVAVSVRIVTGVWSIVIRVVQGFKVQLQSGRQERFMMRGRHGIAVMGMMIGRRMQIVMKAKGIGSTHGRIVPPIGVVMGIQAGRGTGGLNVVLDIGFGQFIRHLIGLSGMLLVFVDEIKLGISNTGSIIVGLSPSDKILIHKRKVTRRQALGRTLWMMQSSSVQSLFFGVGLLFWSSKCILVGSRRRLVGFVGRLHRNLWC